jgi:helicase MOV-10
VSNVQSVPHSGCADRKSRSYVKLVQNFRSHPRILEFPNRWFYELELEPCADRAAVGAFERWRHHPRPGRRFPVIFHAIAGQDEREASSPSYFNRLEAIQVKSYVRLLVDEGIVGTACRIKCRK